MAKIIVYEKELVPRVYYNMDWGICTEKSPDMEILKLRGIENWILCGISAPLSDGGRYFYFYKVKEE